MYTLQTTAATWNLIGCISSSVPVERGMCRGAIGLWESQELSMHCELLPPLTISNALLRKKNCKKNHFPPFIASFTPQESWEQPQLSWCFARCWVGPCLVYSLGFFCKWCKEGEIQLSLFLPVVFSTALVITLPFCICSSLGPGFEVVTYFNLFHEIQGYLLFVNQQILLYSWLMAM